MSSVTTVESAVDLCIRAQREMFGSGRAELADELVTAGCVDHTAPREVPPGPEGIKAVVAWLHRTFDDLHYVVEDAFGDGDRVALRCTVSGVHSGELAGHAPTGRRFENNQIHMYGLRDGRIAEHWGVRDDVTMMRQLGLIGGEGGER
jgi:predicted ester cyclase